MTYYSYRILRK